MAQGPTIDINVQIRKRHVILLAVLVVGATATATVEIKDQTNIFQALSMTGNPIQDLQNPQNPQDAATKSYVDGQSGGLIDSLNFYKSSDSADDYAYTEVSCRQDEALVGSRVRQDGANDGGITPGECEDISWFGEYSKVSINELTPRLDIGGQVSQETFTGNYETSCVTITIACRSLPQTQTAVVTIDANGQTGATETYMLDTRYDEVIKAELMGDGIQPDGDGDGDPDTGDGPELDTGDRAVKWRIDLYNTNSETAHPIARSIGWGSYSSYSYDYSVFTPRWGQYYRDYVDSFPVVKHSESVNNTFNAVSADSVRLRLDPDSEYVQNPEDEPGISTTDWAGTEQIKITYIP